VSDKNITDRLLEMAGMSKISATAYMLNICNQLGKTDFLTLM
jgi:hypothetical protein